MTIFSDAIDQHRPETPFFGLAPFLRMNIAGADLLPICKEMLVQAEKNPTDAELWMNLSVVMQCIGQRDIGLAIQDQALDLKRIYRISATVKPEKFRLLILAVPGDIAANIPLDCLLEDGDIELIFYYVAPDVPLGLSIPEHDALIVAISDSDENRAILGELERSLAHWSKPVINAPQHIPATGRDAASKLLQDAPDLLIPLTLRATSLELQDIAAGQIKLSERFSGCDFPIILRPIDSQAGRDLDRISSPQEVADYLSKVSAPEFFLSRFIDYSGQDGRFRKFRIALIDGKPYACHMAVSSNWMVHYVNAGMYEDADKRDEEASFMAHFDDFAQRHQLALSAIYQRTKLDYVCIDCAETHDGQLLIFEIDHTMVVHAMDPQHLFPYKQFYMQKVQDAFRDFLFRLTSDKTITDQ